MSSLTWCPYFRHISMQLNSLSHYSIPSGQRRVRPNAFVSIWIPSPEIRNNVERVQQDMIRNEPLLESAMVPLEKLHITLMVMLLNSAEEEER